MLSAFQSFKNKLVITRDVVFDEMEEWQWTLETTKAPITYDFIEPLTTPNEVPHQHSQQASASTGSPSSSSLNPKDYDSDSPPRKVRSLREIYESCDVAFFACEPQNFGQAVQQEVWIHVMNEEIEIIEKNNTWELTNLPEG